MEKGEIIWKDFHHQIYQIYHGLIALTLVPFALLFLEWDSGTKKVALSMGDPIVLLILQLVWITVYVSWYVWKGKKVSYERAEGMTLDQKLREFKVKSVYKYLLLALGGVVAAFGMWLMPSFVFVLAYFGVLVQYSFLRPSEDKIIRDMQLSKEDRDRLHKS